jgi:hypothetical protein
MLIAIVIEFGQSGTMGHFEGIEKLMPGPDNAMLLSNRWRFGECQLGLANFNSFGFRMLCSDSLHFRRIRFKSYQPAAPL